MIATDTKLGRYEIRSQIGAGGMGEVYRARDEKLNRDVAIKVLPAALSQDADRLRRFEQEAQAAGALNHPNILAVYDVGTHDGAPYVVSELLEGETLRERLDGPPIPQRKAVDYATQIARGLAAAHARSIVHRDLKPENIFIATDGQVKILDFGLAKLIEPVGASPILTDLPTRKLNTTPGTVLGTLGYMSPEQVDGKPVDYRSDIFSFGVVLYEMLAGKRAFPQRETLRETLHAIATEDPPALSELNPHVSPSLEKVVERCLEKKPDDRFQSTRDLAFALEALSGASTTSHPELSTMPNLDLSTAPGVTAPASPRLWKIVAIAAMLAAVALSIGAFIFGKRAGTTPPPSYQRLTFSRGTIWNARFAPDGQTVVYSARWNGNPLEVFAARAGKVESRTLKLENTDVLAISAANEMAVLRNRQYFGRWFVSRGTLARMPVDGGAPRDILEDVQEADWSPDGTKLAVVRWVNGQNQLEYPVGKVLYETAGYISHPRISPKGDLVAFMDHQVQGDNRGWVAVADLSGKKTVLSGEWGGEEGLAWSPAGDEVWFTAGRSGEASALYAVTLSGMERLVLRMTSHLMLHDISRDGRVLFTSYSDSQNIISQTPGETKERDLSWLDHGRPSYLSSDGKTILISYDGEGGGVNYAVYLRQTDGSPAVRLGDGALARLSPDGKWALTVLFTPPQLVLLPTGAGEARSLERGPIEQYSGATSWFPDGKRVIFQGREPGHNWRYYLQIIEGGPPRPITPEGTIGTLQGIFISPDSGLVIASDAQHQRSLYPVEGGAPKPISHLESADEILGWSGDGHSLYLAQTQEMPIRVYRFDPATGRRELLKEVMPADPAGIFAPNNIFMTPDGKGYVYSVRRMLSNLYVVEGLK
jgi:serine/threonine protein kinase/Tol biopolymer transport system component